MARELTADHSVCGVQQAALLVLLWESHSRLSGDRGLVCWSLTLDQWSWVAWTGKEALPCHLVSSQLLGPLLSHCRDSSHPQPPGAVFGTPRDSSSEPPAHLGPPALVDVSMEQGGLRPEQRGVLCSPRGWQSSRTLSGTRKHFRLF